MSIERKQAISDALEKKGFETKETGLGIMIRGERKPKYSPMEDKSRNLVTIGGENDKPVDMKLGSILTKGQQATEEANWDTYGRECRETSDKYDAENGIC